jgi:hypothetical protein
MTDPEHTDRWQHVSVSDGSHPDYPQHVRLEPAFYEAYQRIRGSASHSKTAQRLIDLGRRHGTSGSAAALRVGILVATDRQRRTAVRRIGNRIVELLREELGTRPTKSREDSA